MNNNLIEELNSIRLLIYKKNLNNNLINELFVIKRSIFEELRLELDIEIKMAIPLIKL